MKIELLQPDVAPSATTLPDRNGFAQVLDSVGAALKTATTSEDAFASGVGSLEGAMYDRARADVTLSIATAVAQRGAQALNAIFNLQI